MSDWLDLRRVELRTLAAEDLRTLSWLHASERDACSWLALADTGFPAGLTLVRDGPDGAPLMMMDLALQGLQRAVAAKDPAIDDRLAADYAAIYLTHALRASPCESVWRDEEHLMLQGPTFEVRECYRRHGLAVAPTGPDALPDDHLTHELAFCAHLLVNGADAELISFLDQHLLRWLPEFASRVLQRADTEVYASLAALTLEAAQQLREAASTAVTVSASLRTTIG